ncbi:hypothetical protein X734_04290 [Mesorhizobium sp. L2C084A000]|nr:hypothetical protein X734_04290 [Mesorhizobium sp. L2C084A000]
MEHFDRCGAKLVIDSPPAEHTSCLEAQQNRVAPLTCRLRTCGLSAAQLTLSDMYSQHLAADLLIHQ